MQRHIPPCGRKRRYMTHLEDGTLQAFLDDELAPGERAQVAEHLLGCERCHETYESLAQANALFTQSVSVLDVEPPARKRATSGSSPVSTGTASFVRAAALVLVLAAAASAAVPGSPVREWVLRTVDRTSQPAGPEDPAPGATADRRPSAPAGVAVHPSNGSVLVALNGLEAMEVRLETASGTLARVSVVDAEREPGFRTSAGRVEVRDGTGGSIRVRMPAGVSGARLEVDGRLYAETTAGVLRIHVPADTVGGDIVWRVGPSSD